MKLITIIFGFLVMVFSCTSNRESDKKENVQTLPANTLPVNEQIILRKDKYIFDTLNQTPYYPKKQIPEWVKSSISEEKLALLQQLSDKYEISYDKPSAVTNKPIPLNSDLTIDILLDTDFSVEAPSKEEVIPNVPQQEPLTKAIPGKPLSTIQHTLLKNIISSNYAKLYTMSLYGHYGYSYLPIDSLKKPSKPQRALEQPDSISYYATRIHSFTHTIRTAGITLSTLDWEDQGSYAKLKDPFHFHTHTSGRVITRTEIDGIGANICLAEIEEVFLMPVKPL